MSIARFSIRTIIFAVFLVAANFALLKPISGYCPLGFLFGVLGMLPMANILAIACYRNLSRRTAGRPFFASFALTGSLLVVVWFNVCMTAAESRLIAFNTWMNRTIFGMSFLHDIAFSIDSAIPHDLFFLIVYLSFFALLTAVPQLLLALFVGWVARRFSAARNPTPPGVPSARAGQSLPRSRSIVAQGPEEVYLEALISGGPVFGEQTIWLSPCPIAHLPPDHDLHDPRRQKACDRNDPHGPTDSIEPIRTWPPPAQQEQGQPAAQHGEAHGMHGDQQKQIRPDPTDAEQHRNMPQHPDRCHRHCQHDASRKTRLAQAAGAGDGAAAA